MISIDDNYIDLYKNSKSIDTKDIYEVKRKEEKSKLEKYLEKDIDYTYIEYTDDYIKDKVQYLIDKLDKSSWYNSRDKIENRIKEKDFKFKNKSENIKNLQSIYNEIDFLENKIYYCYLFLNDFILNNFIYKIPNIENSLKYKAKLQYLICDNWFEYYIFKNYMNINDKDNLNILLDWPTILDYLNSNFNDTLDDILDNEGEIIYVR